MDAQYHRQMLARALAGRVSASALEAIQRANLGQDSLRGLLRPEYHFDGEAGPALAYVEQCRAQAAAAHSPAEAQAAFGRLSHAVQDFYAHSNYISLWLEGRPDARPDEINGLDADLLRHPRLTCAQMYYPLEALWLFGVFRPLLRRVLPADSHARMNLDGPETGQLFPFGIEAAVQRTVLEFERTLALIGETRGEGAMAGFTGLAVAPGWRRI